MARVRTSNDLTPQSSDRLKKATAARKARVKVQRDQIKHMLTGKTPSTASVETKVPAPVRVTTPAQRAAERAEQHANAVKAAAAPAGGTYNTKTAFQPKDAEKTSS